MPWARHSKGVLCFVTQASNTCSACQHAWQGHRCGSGQRLLRSRAAAAALSSQNCGTMASSCTAMGWTWPAAGAPCAANTATSRLLLTRPGARRSSRGGPLPALHSSDTALHSPGVPVNPWGNQVGAGLRTGPSGWEGGAACWCATAAADLPARGRKQRPSTHRCGAVPLLQLQLGADPCYALSGCEARAAHGCLLQLVGA